MEYLIHDPFVHTFSIRLTPTREGTNMIVAEGMTNSVNCASTLSQADWTLSCVLFESNAKVVLDSGKGDTRKAGTSKIPQPDWGY